MKLKQEGSKTPEEKISFPTPFVTATTGSE
jgi:hypothetical protein